MARRLIPSQVDFLFRPPGIARPSSGLTKSAPPARLRWRRLSVALPAQGPGIRR
jgi:hypothetical protein